MTTFTNSFEGITPSGTTVTTGNSGGASGNAFDTVNIGASAAITSDSTHAAHGSLACALTTGASTVTVYAAWNTSFGSGIPQIWFRQYLYFTANPAAAYRVFVAFSAPAGSICSGLQLNPGGTLTFQDDGGATIFTTTATVPLNQWFRIEGFIIGSLTVGQVELKLFKTADSTIPDETDTSAASFNTRGTMGDWRFGVNTSRANVVTWWQDDIGLSNTGYLGPAAPSPVPAVPASPGQTWLRRFHHRQNLGPPNQSFAYIYPATVTTTASEQNAAADSLATTVTTTGAQQDTVAKTLAGSAATSGTLKNTAGKALTGTVSPTGGMQQGSGKALPVTVATTGTLARALARALAVTVTTSAFAARGVSRALATSVATAGGLARGVGKLLRATVAAVGALVVPQPPPVIHHATVTITPAGPLAATVGVTAGPAATLTVPAAVPGFVPGAAIPGIAVPGADGSPAVTLAAGMGAGVTITPTGPGSAKVTVTPN